MSRRIDIELTSARPDGTWTWRAAGARAPRGVLDGSLLPTSAATGSIFTADAQFELDGITIVAVVGGKQKVPKAGLLELIGNDKPFEGVTQQLARDDRSDRGDRRARRDRPPRDGERQSREGDRRPRRDGDGARRADRGRSDAERGPRPDRPRSDRPRRAHFEAPPELPQRPKPKRLKPGRAHRNHVMESLPEAQRAVAERALQGGLPAVRQAVQEQNARLKADGKEEIPAAGLVSMAEQLLPRLRVAEWHDRADAALRDLDELDLRDLRSVVAAAEDPMVARDESTREVAASLREALIVKQEKELSLWYEDIDAALGVGRVVRALKLSSHPPKAGVRFPAELAAKLAAASTASLTADALPDRWVAVLEAAAFSPVRSHVTPAVAPSHSSDELTSTVKRVAALLPQVAALFGVDVAEGAPAPKPLRPTRPAAKKLAKQVPPPPPAPVPSAAAAVEQATDLTEVAAPTATVDDGDVAEVAEVAEPAGVAEPGEVAEVAEPADENESPPPVDSAG
jgi:hypothetical protein